MRKFGRTRAGAWLGALLGFLGAGPARAADYPVRFDCPNWSGEAVGQVEARIRAALQAAELDALDIAVTCNAEARPDVRVISVYGELTRGVVRRSEHVEDDVVWSVESALRELSRPSQSAFPSEPVTPAAVAATSTPPAAPAPAVAAAEPGVAQPSKQRVTQLSLAALGERWGDSWALGAEAGVSSGYETFQYGIALAGLTALDEPSHFELAELTGSARLSLSLRQLAGLRAELGAGLSSLVTMPEGAVAESRTALGVAFLELRLSRPFRLGTFAVSPSLGARAFSARRRVRVDGEQRFDSSALAPQLALSLTYRL